MKREDKKDGTSEIAFMLRFESEDVRDRVKIIAIHHKMTMQEYITALINEALEKEGKKVWR